MFPTATHRLWFEPATCFEHKPIAQGMKSGQGKYESVPLKVADSKRFKEEVEYTI